MCAFLVMVSYESFDVVLGFLEVLVFFDVDFFFLSVFMKLFSCVRCPMGWLLMLMLIFMSFFLCSWM